MGYNHEARLVAAFIHNPSEYVLEAIVDVGHVGSACVCGHPIRYEHYVKHPTGHTVILGSECIEQYECLDGIKKQLDERRAKGKAAKEAAIDEECQGIYAQLLAVKSYTRYCKRMYPYRSQSYFMYKTFVVGDPIFQCQKLKTVKGRLKKAKTMLQGAQDCLPSYTGFGFTFEEFCKRIAEVANEQQN